ncbi:hypothetical protein OWR29_28050 [Actinoplanes sp. Pm04-4]|uniref:Uncharacterized protein n=1 Tax=Paractinoplanes pyxinae TaxID=2997416 RepID=A0ABT4B759_9ACTN|nr:hypothetical protein [Actinoplanes pyxinae]MCY1141867.1 hypothetical protein [Actinoplanes pyxinae]
MATPDLPESMRAHLAAQEAQPPLETAREFLAGHLSDADSLAAVRARLQRIAQHNTRLHRRVLGALEAVLATSYPPDTLARLVGWDANWVLDDPTDAGAAQFLRDLAQLLRDVINEAA